MSNLITLEDLETLNLPAKLAKTKKDKKGTYEKFTQEELRMYWKAPTGKKYFNNKRDKFIAEANYVTLGKGYIPGCDDEFVCVRSAKTFSTNVIVRKGKSVQSVQNYMEESAQKQMRMMGDFFRVADGRVASGVKIPRILKVLDLKKINLP